MEEIRGVVWPTDSNMSLNIYNKSNESVSASLRALLLTTKRERFMEPEFGTNLRHMLFDQGDPIISSRIAEDIKTAIGKYEKRISMLSDVSVDLREHEAFVSFMYCLKSDLVPKKFQLKIDNGR